MSKLIDFESYPISPVLDRLLQDKTTKQNIIFATDAYLENGPDFAETAQITVDKLLGYMKIKIQPRVEKAAEELKASMLTRCCGETRESNLAMRRVFERCGYRLNKTEESYYENPTESACKYVLRREELE